MLVLDAAELTAERPWGAMDLAEVPDATARLHWSDTPYVWHVHDGVEVFVVHHGVVGMHHRVGRDVVVERLTPGRICAADVGDEHVAHTVGAARILVIEQRGSI